MAAQDLPLESVIGFGGSVPGGLILHPDGNTMMYPLGSTIVIKHKLSFMSREKFKSQEFLQGHSDRVSCLALSRSGRFLASGQTTHMGFAADIIIWNLATRELVHRMALHKVKVQSLSFSSDEKFLASLGGKDDNNIVVWNVETGKAVCGSPTPTDDFQVLRFFNKEPCKVVAGGIFNVSVWDFDPISRKITMLECHIGHIKRICQTLVIDDEDEFVYAGTRSGDVLQVSLSNRLFRHHGPKTMICQGVHSLAMANKNVVIVGGGDGTVNLLSTTSLRIMCAAQLKSTVTSVVLADRQADGSFEFYAGTAECNIYSVRYSAKENVAKPTLVQTCHFGKINDVTFPAGYSQVFASCSERDIKIWHSEECRELLRIQVPNVECLCIAFMPHGKSILSGWRDGKIRAFGPQSGKLLYTIHEAHPLGVTAICGTTEGNRIISGGKEGQVRVWRIGKESQSMIASMKEHKGPVNCIQVRRNDSECVSASSDGSCIIWDLTRFARNSSLFANTFFKAILYHPDESQLLTTGTDRKITYWDAYDGQAIRILDGSLIAEMNALDISPDGTTFVSGSADKLVKLWGYDEGHCNYFGQGHSGSITKVKISPDQKRIVSVGEEGAILIWKHMSLKPPPANPQEQNAASPTKAKGT